MVTFGWPGGQHPEYTTFCWTYHGLLRKSCDCVPKRCWGKHGVEVSVLTIVSSRKCFDVQRSLVSNCVWDKRVIMSPGECYLMQLSAKITHSTLSELVIAIYRRADTMKKMGPGNLNWTPNTGGEFQWKYSAPHAIRAPLLPHMSVSARSRTGWSQSKILRSNLMFFSPMIGSAPASQQWSALWQWDSAPVPGSSPGSSTTQFWFCLSMFAFHCVANYRSGFL